MMPPRTLAAFHIPAFPPVRPTPVMQIRTPDGELVDLEGSVAFLPGPRGWDEVLRRMGYTRISRHWSEIDDLGLGGDNAHLCQVAPAAQAGATGHAAAHLTTGLLPTCTSYTLLSREHAEQLGGNEFGFHSGDLIECEYGAAHRLPHTGLGQVDSYDADDGGDESKQLWWWLLWHGGVSRLTAAQVCGVEGRSPGDGHPLDPCALPRGHEVYAAAHSWQLTAFAPGQASRTASRAARGDIPPRRPGQH